MKRHKLKDVIAKLADLENKTLKGVYESEMINLNVNIDDSGIKTNLLTILYFLFKSHLKVMEELANNEQTHSIIIEYDSEVIIKQIQQEFETLNNKNNDTEQLLEEKAQD